MSHILGSASAGWLDLSPRLSEWRPSWESVGQSETVSAAGVLTLNRRAVKRRWALSTSILTAGQWAAIEALYRRSPGPYWFYSPGRPSLLPMAARLLRTWQTQAGAVQPASPDLRVTLTSNTAPVYSGPYTSPRRRDLAPVTAGVMYTAAITSTVPITLGIRWYRSTGVAISNSTGTGSGRFAVTAAAPAGAIGALLYVQGSVGARVTDPVLIDGTADPGPGWSSVLIRSQTEEHYNPMARTVGLELAEV